MKESFRNNLEQRIWLASLTNCPIIKRDAEACEQYLSSKVKNIDKIYSGTIIPPWSDENIPRGEV